MKDKVIKFKDEKYYVIDELLYKGRSFVFCAECDSTGDDITGNYSVLEVKFLNNDLVAAFGDDKVVLYSMKQKPSVVKEIAINKEIKSIFYDDSYVGLILDSGQADNPYTMVVYDSEGDKVCEKHFNFSYKNIKIANKTIILYNDVALKVYTVKGKEKYDDTFSEGIVDVIMLEDKYTYLIVSPISIKKIKLK